MRYGSVHCFDAPVDVNTDDQIEWAGSNPIHLTAPALRGIRDSLLRCATLEVGRGDITVRVINGLEQHARTAQKGTVLSVNVISPGNIESRRIICNGDKLMPARSMEDRPIIPTYRKFLLVSNGDVRNR